MDNFIQKNSFSDSCWVNAIEYGASGSEYNTPAKTRAGSNEIIVDDPGDFREGQWVDISGCFAHSYGTVYNEKEPFYAENQKILSNELEIDCAGAKCEWMTFIVHFFTDGSETTLSWMAVDSKYQTKKFTRPVISMRWEWQSSGIQISDEWIDLVEGIRIRLNKKDWLAGQSVSFHVRKKLLTRIVELRENIIKLENTPNIDSANSIMKHNDQFALQLGLDTAIREKKGFFIPCGRYRLETGLWIRNSSVRIEGASRENTILDISEAHTSAFWIAGGKEIIIRNLAMKGHTGFLELPSNTSFPTASGYPFWPTANRQMEVRGCAAVNFASTEFLVFEDLNVSGMASEAFYSHGSDRYGRPAYIQAPHKGIDSINRQYTKSCSFNRCNVSNCGFNAFNNNDHAENTNITNCHVEKVANFCENASRFTRITGNYALDGCATSVHGTAYSGEKIGPTQAIISNNVFEGGTFQGGLFIGSSATQVIVSNNIFSGFGKEAAVMIDAHIPGKAPVRHVTVTGNSIDMTATEGSPDNVREAVQINASNIIVSDNQIFHRGEKSGRVSAISISESSRNVNIHDNTIDGCDYGIRAGYRVFRAGKSGNQEGFFEYSSTESEIKEIVSKNAFKSKLPGCWEYDKAAYSGFKLRWISGKNKGYESLVESYDRITNTMTIKDQLDFERNDVFIIYPDSSKWQIHHNTMIDCTDAISINQASLKDINISDNIISK